MGLLCRVCCISLKSYSVGSSCLCCHSSCGTQRKCSHPVNGSVVKGSLVLLRAPAVIMEPLQYCTVMWLIYRICVATVRQATHY